MKTLNLKKTALSTLALLLAAGSADAALLSRANGTMVYDDIANLTWIADTNLFKTLAASNPNLVAQTVAAVPVVHDTPNSLDTPANSGNRNITAADFDAASGRMTWFGAQSWASGLSYGGFDDWRVPTAQPGIVGTGCQGIGYTCQNSEMGTWFASVGGVPGSYLIDRPAFPGSPTIIPGTHNAYFNLFSNFSGYGNYSDGYNLSFWTSSQGSEQQGGSTSIATLAQLAYVYSLDGSQGNVSKNLTTTVYLVRTGDVAAVPVPAAVWLFGTAMAALAGFGRRKAC